MRYRLSLSREAFEFIEWTMSRCATCNFNLENTNPDEVLKGHCEQCNALVCFTCGCTMERACVRDCADGRLTCSFEQLRLGEAAPGRLGMAYQSTPGLCNFCLWGMAEQMYAEVTEAESMLAVARSGFLFG